MAYTEVAPNTGNSLKALDANSVRALWQKTVDMFEQSTDFFAQFEGKGMTSPILVKTDTEKGNGQKVTITTRAGYYGEGKSGDDLFEETTDFEEDLINSYGVTVDFLRNATSMSERAEELMGMRGELADGSAAELGKWMGREKTSRMMMLFRERGGNPNLVVASGKGSENDLGTADGLDWDEIVNLQSQLEPMGGRPAKVATKNGVNIFRYLVVGTTPGLFSLEVDPDFKQVLREAGARGDENPLFEGGYVDVRGNYISKYNPIDHDGHGPVGSPWNPKAFLGEAISAGTTTFAIKGGGSAAAAAKTHKKYFKWFGNYAFEFLPDDVLTPGAGVKYLLIVNPRDGSANAGKVGMYAYTTGNNGNTITITERLGSAAAGARVTTLGAVTWDTGVWDGKHTDVHPIGATIIPCNSKGVPIGDTVLLGASAALRGYGKYRNHRSQEQVNGGFVTRRYISSVFGQALRKDTQGRAPGYIRLRHAIRYAGLGLPTVV